MSLFSKIFGTHSDHEIKRLNSKIKEIEALKDKYAQMDESELKAQTEILKRRLANGETTDDILAPAFATVREAAKRVMGTPHYTVQLIGGIVLHQGRIAEMKTGEGKTLTATLPAYLNALSGNGVHIVTVNDYLARRDSEWMGKIYNYLGLSVGLIVHGQTKEEKKKAYSADITYGTNNEFGFDYLRDNMVIFKQDMVQRGHSFAIVDEVDSILIDEARTPLIISGEGDNSTPIYNSANAFAKRLKAFRIKETDTKSFNDDIDADYVIDEKARTATLTSRGIEKAESYFSVSNLSDPENTSLLHHINMALRAVGVMKRDVDYVVKDGAVIIVDSFTGRMMFGRRYSDGLHQAIEAKEGVKIEKESKTLATITFQNYFRLYKKLSGMTGTALTEESEFREIYALDVIEIPTNKPMIRIDTPDRIYKNQKGKYRAIIAEIKAAYEKGQPVLVGTVSIDKSELISALLQKENIPHNVLNAKQHMKEAEIVAQAGKFKAVTISTNMAGRGTDIKLGGNPEYMALTKLRTEDFSDEQLALADSFFETDSPEIISVRERYNELVNEFKKETSIEAQKVIEAGGLYIIGTERHESRRIDNQLRGRSGRQGDAGKSTFFLSFEDDLLRLFGSDRIIKMVETLGLDEDTAIDMKMISNSIESAQKRLEGMNFNRRKNVLMYDDVMNQQRTIIYDQRREVLDGKNLKDKILSMLTEMIENYVDFFCASEIPDEWNFSALREQFKGILTFEDDFQYTQEELGSITKEKISDLIISRAMDLYSQKEELFTPEVFREVERILLLRNVDEKWMEHLDVMSELMNSIGLQAYGQRNPIVEYKLQGSEIFEQMTENIKTDTVMMLLRAVPKTEIRREQVAKITGTSHGGADTKKTPVKKGSASKVGRNDPCPCGSGKKYKKCCGATEENQ